MNRLRFKRPRLKLAAEPYRALRNEVLARDSWRCQCCGSAKDLQVHHLRSRSKLGDDVLENLITLCAICHKQQHNGTAGQRKAGI